MGRWLLPAFIGLAGACGGDANPADGDSTGTADATGQSGTSAVTSSGPATASSAGATSEGTTADPGTGTSTGPNRGTSAGSTGSETAGSTGSTGCVAAAGCDDSNPCTVDACTNGVCEQDEQALLGSVCALNNPADGRCVLLPGGGVGCLFEEGQPCDDPQECAAGNCVDDFCCDAPCTGNCDACGQLGLQGLCSPVPDVCGECGTCDITGNCAADQAVCSPGNNLACTTCTGSGTAWSCSYAEEDGDCADGQECVALDQCLSSPGTICTSDGECASDHCVCGEVGCGIEVCHVSGCSECEYDVDGLGSCSSVGAGNQGEGCTGVNEACNGAGNCGCATGWIGPSCDTCAAGYYGPSCTPCSCVNGTCDDGSSGTGACTCDLGWAGATCSSCASGWIGANCDACGSGATCSLSSDCPLALPYECNAAASGCFMTDDDCMAVCCE